MKSYELKMAALRTKMRDYLLVTVVRERDLQIHQLREEGKDLQNRYESAVVSERYILIINNYLFLDNMRPHAGTRLLFTQN